MNDYNVVEQRNNKSPTHFEKEPKIGYYYYLKNHKMVAEQGFEPRQNDSESFVLPLHYSAIKNFGG